MYAHVTDGVVDSVSTRPPDLVFEDGRWWDLRDLSDTETLFIVGWFVVVEIPKPDDTPTTTWEALYTPNGLQVDQSWNEIPKSTEQLQSEADAAARMTIEQALSDALIQLQAIIDDTNSNINTNPAARIKDVARALRRTIRLVIRRFDGTD